MHDLDRREKKRGRLELQHSPHPSPHLLRIVILEAQDVIHWSIGTVLDLFDS